jgi:hypothetical protein
MTARIRRLPGNECRHFASGRCLFEEQRNPGYHRDWRCRVLAQWEESYDEFLLRAEAFRLEDAAAAGLWERRMERLVAARPDCPDFRQGGAGATGCVHALADLCLLRLPGCAGRCRRFAPCPRPED